MTRTERKRSGGAFSGSLFIKPKAVEQGGLCRKQSLENRGAAAWGDEGSEKVQWTFSPKNARPVGEPGGAETRLPRGDEG